MPEPAGCFASSAPALYPSPAGRTAPAARLRAVPDLAEAPLSTDSPPQLSDPAWLRRRLVTDGTMGIALELHVSRYQVRKACERFGLSRPAGRRRGATPDRPALRVRRPASEQIADRIAAEQALDPPLPATVDFVLERCGNVMRAHYANDRLGVNDALVSLASACGLVVDHMQRVNAA